MLCLRLQAGQTCENNVCKYECNVDSDCTDPQKPLCSDDHLCVAGCRGDEDCDGYNNVCNLPGYENCNYCSGGGANEIGSCNPGIYGTLIMYKLILALKVGKAILHMKNCLHARHAPSLHFRIIFMVHPMEKIFSLISFHSVIFHVKIL